MDVLKKQQIKIKNRPDWEICNNVVSYFVYESISRTSLQSFRDV